MAVFCNFVREVRRHYQANPYHNFIHAFDVLQTVYSLLVRRQTAFPLPLSLS